MGRNSVAKKPRSGEHITLTRQELKKHEDDMFWRAFRILIPVVAWSLHEEYGFGGKRIDRFMRAFKKYLDYLDDGTFTLTDIIKQLQIEADLDTWLPRTYRPKMRK